MKEYSILNVNFHIAYRDVLCGSVFIRNMTTRTLSSNLYTNASYDTTKRQNRGNKKELRNIS